MHFISGTPSQKT